MEIDNAFWLMWFPVLLVLISLFYWIFSTTDLTEPSEKPIMLFLDDERNPEDVTWINLNYSEYDITVVRTYSDFVEFIENNELPTIISLDHDIQDFAHGSEKTGYDCVKFFCDYFIDEYDCVDSFPMMVYHTNNPVGKGNMSAYVENFKKFLK